MTFWFVIIGVFSMLNLLLHWQHGCYEICISIFLKCIFVPERQLNY